MLFVVFVLACAVVLVFEWFSVCCCGVFCFVVGCVCVVYVVVVCVLVGMWAVLVGFGDGCWFGWCCGFVLVLALVCVIVFMVCD